MLQDQNTKRHSSHRLCECRCWPTSLPSLSEIGVSRALLVCAPNRRPDPVVTVPREHVARALHLVHWRFSREIIGSVDTESAFWLVPRLFRMAEEFVVPKTRRLPQRTRDRACLDSPTREDEARRSDVKQSRFVSGGVQPTVCFRTVRQPMLPTRSSGHFQ